MITKNGDEIEPSTAAVFSLGDNECPKLSLELEMVGVRHHQQNLRLKPLLSAKCRCIRHRQERSRSYMSAKIWGGSVAKQGPTSGLLTSNLSQFDRKATGSMPFGKTYGELVVH